MQSSYGDTTDGVVARNNNIGFCRSVAVIASSDLNNILNYDGISARLLKSIFDTHFPRSRRRILSSSVSLITRGTYEDVISLLAMLVLRDRRLN